jgi:inhibitor of cysteine peptidase
MKTLGVVIVALAVATLAAATSVIAAGPKDLARGDGTVLELPGNPSTGYSWRLDAAKSENASIVTIEDLGYVKSDPPPGEKRRMGAPAPYHFRITGVAEGTAKLVFEYVQPWVGKPGKTEELTLHVTAP